MRGHVGSTYPWWQVYGEAEADSPKFARLYTWSINQIKLSVTECLCANKARCMRDGSLRVEIGWKLK